jgi:hypothetical protein
MGERQVILKLKKILAYIIIPLFWIFLEFALYLTAIWPAIKEYRFHTKGSIKHLKDMYKFVFNYKESK